MGILDIFKSLVKPKEIVKAEDQPKAIEVPKIEQVKLIETPKPTIQFNGPSEHFSWGETIVSDTALRLNINNQWPESYRSNILLTANKMEEVRKALGGKPITINSWYRSKALNTAIGGAQASSHMDGLACDFTCASFGTPLEVCKRLVEAGIQFDQLIHEQCTWVHIGFDPKMRNQKMTYFNGVYKNGLMTQEEFRKA